MTANPLSPSTIGSGAAPVAAPGVAGSRITPLDPLRVLHQYKWVLLIVFLVAICVGGILFAFLRQAMPEYTSEAQLLVTGAIREPYEEPVQSGSPKQVRLDVLGAFIKNQIIMIKSDDVEKAALASPTVMETRWYKSFSDAEAARNELDRNLTASQILGSTLIQLSLKGRYESDLKIVLDTVINAYMQQFKLKNETETIGVKQVFVRESDAARAEFDQVQQKLKVFREEHDLASLEAQNDEANIGYNDLASQASALAVRLQTARETFRALEMANKDGRLLQPTPEIMATIEADSAVSLRDERLRGLRERREVALHRMGPDHRAVLMIDRTIQATENERKTVVEQLLKEHQQVRYDQARGAVVALEGQVTGMGPALEEARARLRDLTEKLTEYRRIETDAKAASDRKAKADDLLRSMELSASRPDNAGLAIRLAATSPRLTFPTAPGIILTTVILLEALALAGIFLKEMLDQRIKTPTDVQFLHHAVVLGALPQSTEDPLGPTEVETVVQRDPTGLMAEAYRQTRTALLGAAERDGHRVIMVVGPQPASGVTSAVNNLALSMAHDGYRVLVIDANFRRPCLDRLFNCYASHGLADVLRGAVSLDDAVVHKQDPMVDVLTAGQTAGAAAELLESRAFQQMIDACRSRYDTILIDTPPALLTSEAQILAKSVDAAVIVVRASRDKRGMVARLLRLLESQNAAVLGIILNGVRTSAGGYLSKNYDAFYRYRQNALPPREFEAQTAPAAAPAAESSTAAEPTKPAADSEDERY
ncbi:MAG: polysaccharide biosynthesis tyrosine autokinase [Phycisphaeraceae bacterium]|nr:polysaccharide biosynthesis tyrosine autokinase [Phycisphaeraceae bacterium]